MCLLVAHLNFWVWAAQAVLAGLFGLAGALALFVVWGRWELT
jgi:hypothetical protein